MITNNPGRMNTYPKHANPPDKLYIVKGEVLRSFLLLTWDDLYSNELKNDRGEDGFEKCDRRWDDRLKDLADKRLRYEVTHAEDNAHEEESTELCACEEPRPSPEGVMLDEITAGEEVTTHSHIQRCEREDERHREILWINLSGLALMSRHSKHQEANQQCCAVAYNNSLPRLSEINQFVPV